MTFQQQATEAIRTSGGRMTAQRELLLDLLATTATDIDVETLHQLASQQDAGISLPTVYRTLNTLEQAGLITPLYVSKDHERRVYRIKGNAEKTSTFHFTCRNCGQVIAFQSDLIAQIRTELTTQLGADISTLCMCAGGLCADCREEQ